MGQGVRTLLAAALLWGGVVPASAAPARIVSMNLCTDQLALLLVDRTRIASISFLGADPAESPLAHLAEGIPINHGQAEEVIALKPDLVLTGRYTTGFAKAMLRRLDFPVLEVESPRAVAAIAGVVRSVAAALSAEARAEALLADMDRRLAAVAAASAQQPRRTALTYDANGFTVGRPGVTDDIMTIAGLDNLAPRLGIGEYGTLPIEAMLAARSDHIVHLVYRPGVPSLADAVMQHPALQVRTRARPMLTIRGSLLNCATPMVAEAAERLSAAVVTAP
jgi:iron complex transport system substrate-binding protein